MSDTALFLPPEWAPQAAVWVGWPHSRGEWCTAFEGAREEIAGFVRTLCRVTPVQIACGAREAYSSAWLALEPECQARRVNLHTLPAGDIWLRDTGPIIVLRDVEACALSFEFNGWGGKYVMGGDTMTASGIASVEQLQLRKHSFVLEGGAVEWDGAGRLITTRQCVLNPNRNPDWTEATAEAALENAFRVDQIIWLDDGLLNDHTDGHVDNIARFIGPGRVLCQTPSGADDPNTDTLRAIDQALRATGLHVETLPSPGRIVDEDGNVLPASHMNFLISNGHVFLPTYDETYASAAAVKLEQLMPDHKIVPLPARHILAGGGAFHCMTQQVPDFEERTP